MSRCPDNQRFRIVGARRLSHQGPRIGPSRTAKRRLPLMTLERHLRGAPIPHGEIGGRDPELIDAVVAESPVHHVVVGHHG